MQYSKRVPYHYERREKNMRKFFNIALAAIMIVLSCGLTAVATDDNNITIPELSTSEVITAQLGYNPLNQTYTIAGGFGKEKRGNITVGLRIFDESGSLVQAAVTTANRDEKGRVVFVFEPIVFFDDAASGKYSFELSSFLGNKTLTYEYLNTLDGLGLMLKLDSLSGDAYAQAIINECSGTGADVEIFKNLDPDIQETVVPKLSALKSGLSEETADDPDCVEKVSKAISKFVENYNYHTAVGVFNDCDTETEVGEWIKKYADTYGFKTDDVNTSYSESDLWKYYENTDVSLKAHTQLKAINNIETIEAIMDKVHEAILCSYLDSCHVSAVDQFLGDYSSAFSISLTAYNRLDDKSSVRSGIVNTGLYTYTEIKDKFDTLVSAAQNSGSGSGSGSGRGSGSGVAASGFAGNLTPLAQVQANPFTDLNNAEWAKDYILKLYNKGIINGKQANLFAPNDKITRAEMVKIIVEAFGLEITNGKTFADVFADKWYAKYVSAAADNGVVAGDDTGKFNPDSFVTRQDIAVMLYRVMKISASAPNAKFADFSEVADYARTAVTYFSAAEVINGYPDGSFKPYGLATRAETAKIIASVID